MSEYISYFPTLTATTPEEISWETVTTTIRGDYLRQKTEQYRRALNAGERYWLDDKQIKELNERNKGWL